MGRLYKQVAIPRDITKSSKNAQTISMFLKTEQFHSFHDPWVFTIVLHDPWVCTIITLCVSPSVRSWSVTSENADHGSCAPLPVDSFALELYQ